MQEPRLGDRADLCVDVNGHLNQRRFMLMH